MKNTNPIAHSVGEVAKDIDATLAPNSGLHLYGYSVKAKHGGAITIMHGQKAAVGKESQNLMHVAVDEAGSKTNILPVPINCPDGISIHHAGSKGPDGVSNIQLILYYKIVS